MAEARDDSVGLVALTVHQPVDAALEPIAQRLEQHRDDGGGDERDREAAARPKHRAEIADDEHIDAGDQGGKRAIHECAIDDRVDVPQVVAEDGDGDGYRYHGLDEAVRRAIDDKAQRAAFIPAEWKARRRCQHKK